MKAHLQTKRKHAFTLAEDSKRMPKKLLHTTFAERLKIAMKASSLGPTELARRVGVRPQAISLWRSSDTKKPEGRNLAKAAAALGVSVAWLDEGAGPMRQVQLEVVSVQRDLGDAFDVAVFDAAASMGLGRDQQDGDTIVDHMRISRTWLRENVQASNPRNLAVLTAYGDSMKPTFQDGDILLIDNGANELQLDAVYCIALNQKLFIKRIDRRPDGSILMISDNTIHPPYKFTDTDLQELRVLGRVLWAWNGRKL